jgi:murein lipoprotein
MKKSLLMISIMLVFAIALVGCATTGDLEKIQAQEKQTSIKADQALKTSQDANEAAMKANDAAIRAENAAKAAEERAKIAEERAKKADAVFERSMKK